MKPTFARYGLHSLHGKLSGTQDFIEFLNLFKFVALLISSGTRFHIIGPKYLNDSSP